MLFINLSDGPSTIFQWRNTIKLGTPKLVIEKATAVKATKRG